MVDYRIKTFLTLYEVMNYRKAAEVLNMTQPAVTQHIHALENEYGCKLFIYESRKLYRTRCADLLASYSRADLYNDKQLRIEMAGRERNELRIGATKTIGEYVIGDMVVSYLRDIHNSLTLTVDNTKRLLEMLEHCEIDFAMIEGFFDKNRYGCRLFRQEPFTGLCRKGHPFSGKEVALEDLFGESLILREKGSGTRAIFEQVINNCGYSLDNFRRIICISNFGLICTAVAAGNGISFAYRAVGEEHSGLASFTLKDMPIIHEFNYVYLKGTSAEDLIERFTAPSHRPEIR